MTTDQRFDHITDQIISNYQAAGFFWEEPLTEGVLHFSNRFSNQFVYLVDSYEDLSDGWQNLHRTLVRVYQDHEGPRDMEWNFYAVFLVLEPVANDGELSSLRREIESDTSFSRKFVFSIDQVAMLPPSRITQDDLGRGSQIQTDLTDKWQQTIGEGLFREIMECKKKDIPDTVLDYIGVKKHE